VIHGDPKPENIVPCDEVSMDVKVVDFGSAHHRPTLSDLRTVTRFPGPVVVLRTAHGRAIDVWSVGCVLCELFIGVPLFGGQTEVPLIDFTADKKGALSAKEMSLPPDWDKPQRPHC
jgi:dual specificity protein kinase YAK1